MDAFLGVKENDNYNIVPRKEFNLNNSGSVFGESDLLSQHSSSISIPRGLSSSMNNEESTNVADQDTRKLSRCGESRGHYSLIPTEYLLKEQPFDAEPPDKVSSRIRRLTLFSMEGNRIFQDQPVIYPCVGPFEKKRKMTRAQKLQEDVASIMTQKKRKQQRNMETEEHEIESAQKQPMNLCKQGEEITLGLAMRIRCTGDPKDCEIDVQNKVAITTNLHNGYHVPESRNLIPESQTSTLFFNQIPLGTLKGAHTFCTIQERISGLSNSETSERRRDNNLPQLGSQPLRHIKGTGSVTLSYYECPEPEVFNSFHYKSQSLTNQTLDVRNLSRSYHISESRSPEFLFSKPRSQVQYLQSPRYHIGLNDSYSAANELVQYQSGTVERTMRNSLGTLEHEVWNSEHLESLYSQRRRINTSQIADILMISQSELRVKSKKQVEVQNRSDETRRNDSEIMDIESKKKTSKKLHQCEDCSKCFSQMRNYRYHRSRHEGTDVFQCTCPICGKQFNDKGYLSSHLKIHTNAKEYHCEFCEKSFNQRVAYNMHVRIHTGVKPHECTFCDKAFSRKMLLRQHLRTHTGERPYTCNMCYKSFADRSNMLLHQKLHSGNRPYACDQCDKTFSKNHHLKTHLNHHLGLKPYPCSRCGHAFSQSSNMKTHMKKCRETNKSSIISSASGRSPCPGKAAAETATTTRARIQKPPSATCTSASEPGGDSRKTDLFVHRYSTEDPINRERVISGDSVFRPSVICVQTKSRDSEVQVSPGRVSRSVQNIREAHFPRTLAQTQCQRPKKNLSEKVNFTFPQHNVLDRFMEFSPYLNRQSLNAQSSNYFQSRSHSKLSQGSHHVPAPLPTSCKQKQQFYKSISPILSRPPHHLEDDPTYRPYRTKLQMMDLYRQTPQHVSEQPNYFQPQRGYNTHTNNNELQKSRFGNQLLRQKRNDLMARQKFAFKETTKCIF